MGKSSPSDVLRTVFKDISNVENIIKDSKKIEKSCETVNFDDQKEVDKIIADTKTIVDSLRDQVVKIDEYFDKNYKSWNSTNAPSPAAMPTGGNSSINNHDKESQERRSEEAEQTETVIETGEESQEKQLEEDQEKETVANNDKVPQKKISEEKEIECDNSESLNSETSTKPSVREEDEEPKMFIKCVDIKKLVNPHVLPHLKSPSPTRSNGINDSILIISDSDQETEAAKTEKNEKTTRHNSEPEINKNVRRRDTLSRKLTSQFETLKAVREAKVASVISESDSDSKQSKSKKPSRDKGRRTKKSKGEGAFSDSESKKDKARKRSDKSKKTLDCASLSLESNADDSDSSITSSRSQNSVQKKSVKAKQKVVRYSRKERLMLDAQHDKKMSYEAYVPMLRIPCDKLKEFYIKKMEVDEIKRLTNLDNLKKRLRSNHSDKKDDQSKSDTENVQPKPKRKRKTSTNSHVSNADSVDEEAGSSNALKELESTVAKSSADQLPTNEDDGDQAIKMILDGLQSDSDGAEKENQTEDGAKKTSKKSDKQPTSSKKKSDDKEKDKGSDASASDAEKKKKKGKWRRDKLLTAKISDSESEDEFVKFKKGNEKAKEDVKDSITDDAPQPIIKLKRLCKKRAKRVINSDSDSDSESESKKKNNSGDEFKPSKEKESSSSDSESEKENSEKEEDKDKKKRRRIRREKDSSSGEDGDLSTRKTIRRVIGHASLAEATKQAEKDEAERKARIVERQKKYNQIFDEDKLEDATIDKVVLDFNEETKEEILAVNEDLVKKLKPHQAKGVQFMWDACYESVERTKKTDGSGCILAHCMGLGKTLQVITLVHTLLNNEEITGVKKILVVCPVNTVLNWVAEFKKWLDDVDGSEIEVYELVAHKQLSERQYQIEHWHKYGGVFVIGYDMFRNLTNPNNKRLRKSMREVCLKGLVNPGPDLIVCDEGHLLKNEKTNLSIAMNRVHTIRRIVLTGTPMQNNMKEYYCMVQFVKPNLLGTYKEYLNRFVNPITNGQYTDSTPHDINIMRKRSHVLHKLLDGIVQRKDYSVLTPYLPPKHEYVLFLTLGEAQIRLYQHYRDHYAQQPGEGRKGTTSFLFTDFQAFQRICTHPRVLLDKSEELKRKAMFEDDEDESEGSLKDFIDDGEDSKDESSAKSTSSDSDGDNSKDSAKSKSKGKKSKSEPQMRLTRNSAAAAGIDVEEISLGNERSDGNEWWRQYCNGEELDNIAHGSKLYLLFEILQQCELIGDKLLVFSQSLYSLTIIEYFLAKIDEATQKDENDKVCGFSGSWALGLDYFRLDGSSSCDNRSAWCKSFNSPDNPRARLFLISTKAGGLGINLVGANRVIIFDVSWNPSHDIQSIYRVYRFGQTKPCYIYRFVTWGTMEMKVYERQVTKQAISKRVIDEQQIDRHYNQNDLAELYKFDPKPEEPPTPLVPKDVLLGELLQKEKDRIYKYHEHQTLLENKEDEELDEAERKAAWEEFENEKTVRVNNNMGWIKNLPLASVQAALINIIRKDNPTWTAEQVQSIIPTIVQQLRDQVDAGQMMLFNRVVNEMRLMQATQQRKMQEYYMKQQIQMLQQRLQNQPNAAAMGINFGNLLQSIMPTEGVPNNSNEIVELND